MSDTNSPLNRGLFAGERWVGVLSTAYGFEVQRSASDVPYVALEGAGGLRVVALPFSDYLPLGEISVCGEFLAELRESYPMHEIVIKTTLPAELAKTLPGVEVTREAVLHVMRSGDKPKSKFAQNARRSKKDGLEVRETRDIGGLDRFYDMFAYLRVVKFDSIPQPKRFFEVVHEAFIAQGLGYYLEAVYKGSVVGSYVMLESDGRMYNKFGASKLSELEVRPNNALYGYLRERLADSQYEAVDLGLTGVSKSYEGLRYWKSATGAQESPITYVRSVPDNFDSEGRTAFLEVIQDITQKLVQSDLNPDQLSALSEGIYPYFA